MRASWVTPKYLLLLGLLACLLIGVMGPGWAQSAPTGIGLPSLNVQIGQATGPEDVSKGLQLMALLTILTLAPAILVMTTAFTRIVIVLSLIRHAIGSPTLPPNQIIVSMALILTFFVMAPTFGKIKDQAFDPYMGHKMNQGVAFSNAVEPLRTFMFKQVDEKEVALFVKLAKLKAPRTTKDVPTYVLLPAFVLSELKTAFQMGFIVFLPFIVIDIVVASLLTSMGMVFLPPATISMPLKLALFALVDGWHLVTEALVLGFH